MVTPNIHMHCHLAECIRDYGPLSSFWLFPFERYNGILEGTPTNNRSIEVQIMKRFLQDIQNISLLQGNHDTSSLLADVVVNQAETFQSVSNHKGTGQSSKQAPLVTFKGLEITPAPKHTICTLSHCEVKVVRDLYSKF